MTSNGEITQVKQGSTVTKSAAFNLDGGICWSLAGSSSNSCGTTPSGATAYSYDANGQRTAATTGSATVSNGWNAFGQMCWTAPVASSSSCGSAPSGATSYSYAGNGLRISATNSSSTASYTWDTVRGGSTPLDISDGTNYYVYGPLLFGGTAPIEQISGSTSTFVASIQSGVQDAFSSSGTEQERAQYSLYGTQTITSGTKVTPFGFQGSYTDATGFIFLINRYYDPSSTQFLSIDPDIAETHQPYDYVGNDPLNLSDPLGLKGWYCIGGQTHYYTGNKYGAVGNGTCAQVAKQAFNHYETMLFAYRSDAGNARQWMTPTMIANGFVATGFSQSEKLDSAIGSKAQHAADQSLEDLADKGVRYSDMARSLLVVGSALNVWADLKNHDSVLYTVGDAGGSLAGGWGGAAAGSALCGGPEEPVGWACGILGGFDGAFFGGKGLGWVASKL